MSILNVNQLQPVGGGNTITVGSSNIDYSGSITGNISVDGNLTVTGVVSNEDVTNIDSVGIVTARAGVKIPDSQKVFLGTGDDLHIFHDGNHSFISQEGVGALKIKGDDIRFEDAGGTEAFRITSDGLMQIGTITTSSFPDRLLSVGDHTRTSSYIDIRSGTVGALLFADGTSGNTAYRGQVEYTHSDDRMCFWTAATERVRIDSSGNLQVSSGQFTVGTTASAGLQLINDGTFGTIHSADLKIRTAATERLRIRTDGKISTGTLLDTNNSYEFSIRGADGTGCLYAHGRNHYLSTRSTSHASLTLKKSNADSDGIDYLQLRDSANTYLSGFSGAGNLKPASGKGIDFSNNSHSGGMTSEILDDYEEGTWNPNGSYTFTHATYTKIGRQVFCQFSCASSPSGLGTISLPFTPSNNVTGSGSSEQVRYVGDVQFFVSGGNDDSTYKYVWQGNIGASMYLHKLSGSGAQSWTASFGSNVSNVTVFISYIVA